MKQTYYNYLMHNFQLNKQNSKFGETHAILEPMDIDICE